MPETKSISVRQLKLDLHNFRTVPQKSELAAIRAMISVNPDWFWALTESLLEDGYHVTENILVMQMDKAGNNLIVKEGNRRIAALKLIMGFVRRKGIGIPAHLKDKMDNISQEWKDSCQMVPCAVYSAGESAAVDKIVALTHGKGQKAGRDTWKAVARARHNRDMNQESEPSLDLLERYLKLGKNLTVAQKERWGGDYPLTVLEEVLKRLAPRFGNNSARELADSYPAKIKYRSAIEDILRDIGLESFGFNDIRDKNTDFALTRYKIPATQSAPVKLSATAAQPHAGKPASSSPSGTQTAVAATKPKAFAGDDPRSVIRILKQFTPIGNNREKLVTLLEEARKLKLDIHPHAFCFLLRSMFEISAKAYCNDHGKSGGIKNKKSNGDDLPLVDVLRNITTHLTNNNTDKQVKKELHGALAELAKPESFLSVTSMNQLVHNPKFSVKDTHISALFGNIFPLLETMNR
jgi:hypothetical protein